MAATPRWIIADDTSADIQYVQGGWFQDSSSSQDDTGNFGPVFNHTLHGVDTGPASLVYQFTGSQVRVLGTNNQTNNSGILNPTWQCFVDNTELEITYDPPAIDNSWILCSSPTLQDKDHVLTVNVTSAASPQMFWLDQIQYIPTSEAQLTNATVKVDSTDPMLKPAFGEGWDNLGGFANVTTTQGSMFTLNFTGASIAWFGFIPNHPYPLQSSTGAYSIDGKASTSFFLKGIPTSNDTNIVFYNQLFFQTPILSPGDHQIVVTYTGDGQTTTPLTLDYLIIQNASAPDATPFTLPGHRLPTSNGSKANIGAIAGGVVGGTIVIIALAVLVLSFIRRRRRASASRPKYLIDDDDVDVDVDDDTTPRPYDYKATPVHAVTESGKRSRNSLSTMLKVRRKGAAYHTTNPSITSAGAPETSVESTVAPQARERGQQWGSPDSPDKDDSPPAESQYVLHEDSGIRIHGIIEVPPGYTSK